MNIAGWLQRMAAVSPTRPALFSGRALVADYGAFHSKAAAVATALQVRGVAPGDRVAIFMKNVPDYLVVQYGAWYAGAAVVPINAKLHAREAAWILGDAGAKLVFAFAELAADLTGYILCGTYSSTEGLPDN